MESAADGDGGRPPLGAIEHEILLEMQASGRVPRGALLRREIVRGAIFWELFLVACWAGLSVFVFWEVSGTASARVVAGLFTGLGGVVVGVILLYRRVADRRIRQGLQHASLALRAIESVTDPALSFLPLDALLDEVLARTRQAVGGDVAAVLLLGDKGQQPRIRALQGASGLVRATSDVDAERGVLGEVVRRGKGIIVNDVLGSALPRVTISQRAASLVAAPLLVRDKVIGVVLVASSEANSFERSDLRLLQVVADRCAASIERARLDEAERRSRLGAEHARLHLGLLARSSVALAAALESYDDALHMLADVVVPDFADWFSVDVIDEAGELRRIANAPGSLERDKHPPRQVFVPHRHPNGERLIRLAIANGKPQVVMPYRRAGPAHGGEPAAPGDFTDASPAAGVESMLIIPVRVRGLSFGALSFVTGAGRRGYRKSDLETASGVAERVGVMIERVLAWRQTRASEEAATRYADRLQRLMEAALVVNAPLAEPEVVQVLAEHGRRVLDAARVVISTPHPAGPRVEMLWPAESAVVPDEEARSVASIAADVVARRAAPRRFPEGSPGDLALEKSQSAVELTPWLGVPLTDKEGKGGRVIVAFGQPGRLFDDDDESVLVLLSQMASVALRNAQLYQDVEANEQRLRAVLDASPLAIAELAFTGEPRWWNRAAVDLFGWDPANDGPREIPIQEGAWKVMTSLLARTHAGEATLGTEIGASRPDGEQLELSISTAPLRDAQGNVTSALMVAGDVTERRRLLDQFHQAERLSAMARMAGGLAHDFNNLLTVILGCSEVLLRRVGDEPAVQEEVGAIQRAGQRAAALTAQLLAIGHRRAVQPTAVDLNEVVVSIQAMLSSVIGADIELEVTPYSRPAQVMVDQAELERAILNLAINSRDAMPDGGRLELQVKGTGSGRQYGRPKLFGLVVADTGVGMDAETQDHCFEPFFTTKGLARGTGLGLSTVHAMVTQAGGQVLLDSTPGLGTSITLWFPSHPVSAPAPVGEEASGHGATSGSESILLVEDEPELRRLVDRELTARGYTVRVAANATEALRIAQDELSRFALVVTDVVMPGMSGVELAHMLKSIDPSMPILFVSGHVDKESLSPHTLSEEADLLPKPFTPEQLAGRVREILDSAPGQRRSKPESSAI